MTFVAILLWMKWTWLLRSMMSSLVLLTTLQKISLNMVDLKVFFEKHEVVLSTLFFFFYQYLTNVKDVYMVLTLSLSLCSFLIQGKIMQQQPAESNAASGDSFITCRTEPIICFSSQPAHSNISFSGATGEANDIQDCGVSSSMQQVSREPPPWCPPTAQEISATTRNNAVIRYKEKKKARK